MTMPNTTEPYHERNSTDGSLPKKAKSGSLNTTDELRELYKTVRHNSRMILYNDPIGRPDDDNRREQVGRDDMWAISTEELDSFMQLIETHTQQAVVEARIDEAKRAEMFSYNEAFDSMPISLVTYFNKRIVELNQ